MELDIYLFLFWLVILIIIIANAVNKIHKDIRDLKSRIVYLEDELYDDCK